MPTFERDMRMQGPYLLLGEEFKGPKVRVSVRTDNEGELLAFDAELAAGAADRVLPVDVPQLAGRRVTLRIEGDEAQAAMLEAVDSVDADPHAAVLRREPLRPQLHFTAGHGWINDPNGTIYHRGRYHLFYQWNPFGTRWGNMSWGHAVSSDLVHWQDLPMAFGPDAHGAAYSGCVVHDAANTSGFGADGAGPLVAVYSAAGDELTQCLAFSNDGGQTWTRYADNPVLPAADPTEIDPTVFRHEPTGRWIMLLRAGREGTTAALRFYASENLIDWTPLSEHRMDSTGHCPDMFPLALDGDAGDVRWIIWLADGRYQVGRFDGQRFVPDGPAHQVYDGRMKPRGSLYAARTFASLPEAPARQVSVAWFSQNLSGQTFNQALSLPVEMTLARGGADGPELRVRPARELDAQTGTALVERRDWTAATGRHEFAGVACDVCRIVLACDPSEATTRFGLEVRGVAVTCDLERGVLTCGDAAWLLPSHAAACRLEVFVDRAMIEVFAGDGAVYLPHGCLLDASRRDLAVTVTGGCVHIRDLTVHAMRSMWA